MAYEPTVWKTGDVVSSEKLNKIENGISALSESLITLDVKTYNDDYEKGIYDYDRIDVTGPTVSQIKETVDAISNTLQNYTDNLCVSVRQFGKLSEQDEYVLYNFYRSVRAGTMHITSEDTDTNSTSIRDYLFNKYGDCIAITYVSYGTTDILNTRLDSGNASVNIYVVPHILVGKETLSGDEWHIIEGGSAEPLKAGMFYGLT